MCLYWRQHECKEVCSRGCIRRIWKPMSLLFWTGICWDAAESPAGGIDKTLSCQDESVAAEKGFCWGVIDHGGECSGLNFQGVTDVYSTGSAFLALNKVTGKGFCWGSGING